MQPFKGLRRLGRHIATRLRISTPAYPVVSGPAGDDVPTVEEIANAAEKHEAAREEYNEGARVKRAARKVLDKAPTGVYGPWAVSWVQPSRRDWDREAIAAFYARHGEEVPTRPAPPQLKLTRVVVDPVPADVNAGTASDMVDAVFGAARPEGLA